VNRPCPLCRTADGTAIRTPDGILYSRCNSCGCISRDPVHRVDAPTERNRYLLHENFPDDPGYRRWIQAFLDFACDPPLGPDARILDFGSGPNPVLAAMLESAGYTVELQDRFFAPGRPEGPFDLILALEVFEHLDDPAGELADLASRLAPGGRLAISTEFIPEGDEAFSAWAYRSDITHIVFFTDLALTRAAAAVGLDRVDGDGRRYIAFERPPC